MCFLGRRQSPSDAVAEDGHPEASVKNLKALLGVNSDLTTALESNTDGISEGNADGVSNGNRDDESKVPDNLSGIMHAARGGFRAFELALQHIKTSRAKPEDLTLSSMLELEPGLSELTERDEQLWAQAALGGDVLVLKKISSAVCNESNALKRYALFSADEACQTEGDERGQPHHTSAFEWQHIVSSVTLPRYIDRFQPTSSALQV